MVQQHSPLLAGLDTTRREFSSVLPLPPERSYHAKETEIHDGSEDPHLSRQNSRDLGAIFRSWCGDWHVRRVIHHDDPSKKGVDGKFDGTATFVPRTPSTFAPEEGTQEYLYREQGTFAAANGASFPAQMKYVYQYHPASNRISVWRVKPGASARPADAGEVDNWFHDITLEAPSGAEGLGFADYRGAGDCVAKGTEHLCVRDTYRPYYRFCFRGDSLSEFGIGYDVRGPTKGYVSEAWFERDN